MNAYKLADELTERIADMSHKNGSLFTTDQLDEIRQMFLDMRLQAITDYENNAKQGNNEE